MKKLNCAIIGCGNIGCSFDDYSKIIKTHAGGYFHNSNTKLLALCDIDKNKLKKYGKKYQINKLYTDPTQLFSNNAIDILSICTKIDTHFELVKQALSYNIKCIILEKPISDNLQNAKKIIDMCRKNKTILLIDFQRRFSPTYHILQKLIHQKKLGKIQTVNVYYGSGIANTGSHVFDLIRMLFGEIKSVRATSSHNTSNYSNDPNLDVTLHLTNGITVRLIALNVGKIGIFEMDIIGENGRINLDYAKNDFKFFKSSSQGDIKYGGLIPSQIKIPNSKYSPIQLVIQNAVNCYNKKSKPMCVGMDGYKSLELVICAKKSALTNKEITIPFNNMNYKIHSK